MPDVLDRQTIKAISADARQDIMKLLARRPYTASEIAKIIGKHVTTVTEHLEVLEKSSLIRKRESSHKWVYYELTDKGEHLFKPKFYSWVIVFSLSIVLVFVGFLRLFGGFSGSLAAKQMAEIRPGAPIDSSAIAAPADFVAYGLIIIGIIGLGYLIYRKYKK
jgi:DNA-binding transcriptional ArsR family regulator